MSRSLFAVASLLLGGCATVPPPSMPAPASASHAWTNFDRQGVKTRSATGMADRRSGRALEAADPVRIASVSKLVVALGVMRMVDEGRLDLDRDVSHWLGWTLRNPAFPDQPITLRRLLSHTSGLRDEADYVVPLGSDIRNTLAKAEAFDAAHPPGAFFKYSNLNYPVIATVMEAVTGERFDLLMQRLILMPLGLNACFNWSSCNGDAIARAVVLNAPDGTVLRDDLRGRPPLCDVVVAPGEACNVAGYKIGTNGALFSPQGGLRISADGLATIGTLLLNKGRHDKQRVVSEAGIAAMLTPQWRFDSANGDTEDGFYCAYGLGVQIIPNRGCRDDLLGDGTALVGHAGDAYGLKSGLWVDRRRGRGMSYYATGVAEDAPTGETSFRDIEEWLARTATRTR